MARVSVRVDYAAIQGLFEPSGGVGRFGRGVNRRAEALARVAAPSRTGRLRGSITSSPAVTHYGYKVTIGSNRKYARWVNDGTAGPITPKHSRWLAVGKREGKKPIYKRFVAGQAAQHFLERGINEAFTAAGIPIHI